MTRCRVYYRPDGKVSIDHPDQRPEKKPKDMTNDEWIDAQLIQSGEKKPGLHVGGSLSSPLLPFDDTDTSQLPNGANPRDRKDRNRWRGTKATGVQIDGTVVLKEDIEQQLDNELAKTTPDLITVERLRRKIEKKEHD